MVSPRPSSVGWMRRMPTRVILVGWVEIGFIPWVMVDSYPGIPKSHTATVERLTVTK